MLAYGKLSRDLMAGGYSQGRLGFEFAGTAPGASAAAPARRVMGVARQAIATSVGAPPYLVPARALLIQLMMRIISQEARSVTAVPWCPTRVFQERLHQGTSYLLQGSVKNDSSWRWDSSCAFPKGVCLWRVGVGRA